MPAGMGPGGFGGGAPGIGMQPMSLLRFRRSSIPAAFVRAVTTRRGLVPPIQPMDTVNPDV
jgi:hypothetical protein